MTLSDGAALEGPPRPVDASTSSVDGAAGSVDGSVDVNVRLGTGCVAWPVTDATPFEPVVEPLGVDDSGAIARAATHLAGSWVGTANSPYWIMPTWTVFFSFTTDGPYTGRYDARAESATGPTPALYYGTDLPCDLKRWRLLDLNMEGIEGEIDVTFQYPPSPCYPPGWQGELSSLAFDASANRLHFAFGTSDGHGPITYDLWRTCDQDAGTAPDTCRVPSNGCDYCGNTVCPTGAVLDSACKCLDAQDAS